MKYFNEIAFSQKDISNADIDESHDISIESGNGDRFVIQKTGNERFRITNTSPAQNSLFVDCYSLQPGAYYESAEQKSVFIYDKEFSENSQDGPSFIYGFNPAEPEIWQLKPEDRGCSVKAKNFTRKFYVGNEKYVGVENISFEIRPAEFVGLYGHSGTGKTVLIESLMAPSRARRKRSFPFAVSNLISQIFGLRKRRVTGGDLLIDKKSPKYLADSVAYLPQHIQFPEQIKCRELLKLGCADRKNASFYNLVNIQELLKLCTLSTDILNERVGRLSGGQRRRLALAMALLNKNIRLIIADEPTSGLDIANEMEIMRTLRNLSRSRGITVIVVTHAIAALPLFDRVMVLRKDDDISGASLSYNSLWIEDSFPKVFLSSITQDAERIAFLSSKISAYQVPNCEDKKYQWPFRFGQYLTIPILTRMGKVKRVALAPFRCLWESLSPLVFWQYLNWTKNTIRLILRQSKSLIIFLLLAVCCVLSLQLGVANGAYGHEHLLTLMGLCAPWLCATYATVFTSELLSFYAWEKFSGLRARGFVNGVLSGLIIPCVLISFVFTAGLFLRADNGWLAKQGYDALKYFRARPIIEFFLSQKAIEDYEKDTARPEWKEIHTPIATPPQYLIGLSELGCESQGDEVYKSKTDIRAYEDDKGFNYDLISPLRFFLKQWGILCLICVVGTAMGVAAIGIFRDVKSSTIGLVILFIAFMVFSRAFINQTVYMYSWSMIPTGELPASKMHYLPAITISFFGIGRYIFNVLSYPVTDWKYFIDWIPLVFWWAASVIVSLISFANKIKNWKAISR